MSLFEIFQEVLWDKEEVKDDLDENHIKHEKPDLGNHCRIIRAVDDRAAKITYKEYCHFIEFLKSIFWYSLEGAHVAQKGKFKKA